MPTRGQPPYQATDKDRRLVKEMASCGIPRPAIARVVGCSEPTLRKHFRDELDRADIEANFRVGQLTYATIMGATIPGVPPITDERTRATLAIFWLKTRGRWKETSVHEHSGIDGKPIQIDARAALLDAIARVTTGGAAKSGREEVEAGSC